MAFRDRPEIMREVRPQLWIGNALEARDLARVLELGIEALVDLAIEEPPASLVRELIYCRIPLLDGAGNSPQKLRLAVETVSSLIRAKIPTLVACGAGMSRSPAIAAVAIATGERVNPDEVLQRIVAGFPHDVSPALWQEVTAFLQRLG
jgi:protein-tyrosine phosphatase